LFPSEFAAGGGLCTSQRSTGGNLGQPGGSGGFSEVGAAACARAGQAAGAKGHLYWGSLPRTRDEPAKEVSNSRGPPAPLQAATRAALGLLALDRTWLRPLATLWRPRAPQPRPRTSPPATPLGAAPGQRLWHCLCRGVGRRTGKSALALRALARLSSRREHALVKCANVQFSCPGPAWCSCNY